MSRLETFSAVAAVVSGFHSAAELVAQINKKKGRPGSKAQNEEDFARKQLQTSLETGESQIGDRYAADMKTLGDTVRIGDAIARDRLLHIAVVIQTDIIMSLQMAVKYENAALELQTLHEASIMNRKDANDALDEMKQRILLKNPLARTFVGAPEDSNDTRSSLESVSTSRSPDESHVPDNSVPKPLRIPATRESTDAKTGLARYFSNMRNSRSSISSTPPSQVSTSSSNTINNHPAVNHLLKGKGPDERVATMKDIDDIIAAYQGLRVEGDRAEALASLTGHTEASKRDTLAVLNGGYDNKRDTVALNRDALQMLHGFPLTPADENSEYPAYNHNIFNADDARRLSQWIDEPKEKPLPEVPIRSRWSTTSASSSIYSQRTVSSDVPSLDRNDSVSSHASSMTGVGQEQIGHPYFSNQPNASNAPFWAADPLRHGTLTPPYHIHPAFRLQAQPIAPTQANTPPTAPFTVPPRTHTPPNAPFAALQRPRTPISETNSSLAARRTPIHILPAQETSVKMDPSVKIPSMAPVKLIVSSTIQGPTSAQEKMMDGRPCKDNNYWGFCKGAWAVREELKKGLGLETRPEGMFNTHQIWQCKHCCFEGPSVTIPHPTKKNKKEVVVDPNIYTSAVGIRYRWLFLAKSHVKKKNTDSSVSTATPRASVAARKSAVIADDDTNYGCVICSVEGNVTGIYGNVETLMNHIALEHVRPGAMSEGTMARSKCVLGRLAGGEEEWDLNVPSMLDVMSV